MARTYRVVIKQNVMLRFETLLLFEYRLFSVTLTPGESFIPSTILYILHTIPSSLRMNDALSLDTLLSV